MFAKQMFANVTSFAKFAKILYREHFHAYGTLHRTVRKMAESV